MSDPKGLRAAALIEIIQPRTARHILPTWVGSAAFDSDRLTCRFGTIELQIRSCPLLGGRDAINFKPVAKPLEIVSDPIYLFISCDPIYLLTSVL